MAALARAKRTEPVLGNVEETPTSSTWWFVALWVIAIALLASKVAGAWLTRKLGYDLQPIYAAGQALVNGRPLYAVHNFVYPPGAALLVGSWLTAVPFGVDRHVALLFEAGAYIAIPLMAARALGHRWTSRAVPIVVIVLCMANYANDLFVLENGTVLAAIGATAGFVAWIHRRDLLCGAVLGLTLSIKPMLLPLLIGVLLVRRWRVFGAAILAGAAVNGAALLIDPAALGGVRGHLMTVLNGNGASFNPRNSALWSIGQELGLPGSIVTAGRVAIAGVAIAAVVLIWRRRPEPWRSAEAAFVLLSAFLVVLPLFEDHYGLVLVPFALASLDARSQLRWWPVAVAATFVAGLITVPATSGLSSVAMRSIERGLGLTVIVCCIGAFEARHWSKGQWRPRDRAWFAALGAGVSASEGPISANSVVPPASVHHGSGSAGEPES